MPRAEVGCDVIHHPAVGEVAEHGRRVRVAADAGTLPHLGRVGRRVRRRVRRRVGRRVRHRVRRRVRRRVGRRVGRRAH